MAGFLRAGKAKGAGGGGLKASSGVGGRCRLKAGLEGAEAGFQFPLLLGVGAGREEAGAFGGGLLGAGSFG
jgi:hypothetical protein